MKQITNEFSHFLESQFMQKNAFPHSRFSTISKKLLSDIFSLMIQSKNLFNASKIKITHQVNAYTRGNSYIPNEINKLIENMENITYNCVFTIDSKIYDITMVCPHSSHNKPVKEYTYRIILERYRRIFQWLFVANAFASRSCSRKMNVFLYFTDALKELPDGRGDVLDLQHANTAFTTSCSPETDIHLFREEEWFKVFIHETFHNLGLDFSDMNNDSIDKAILTMFPINSDVRLYETYCETWAELINVMFISYYSTRDTENLEKNIEKMIKKTEQMIHYERIFSLFQCAKVLHFFHLKYKELHENTDKSHASRTLKYKEKTPILAYYILKPIYLFHINDFVEFCVINNNNSLQFHKNTENFQRYIAIFRENYKDPDFIRSLTIFEDWFSNHHSKFGKNMKNSLRMSLHEL